MANDLVHVLNTQTGRVGDVRRRIFEHKVFNPGILVEVSDNAKPYIPELYRPKDADTFLEQKALKTQTEEADAEVDTNTKDAD